MTRDLILQTAMQQYATYGIRGVSMNEIAHSLRISKKTLYCNFKNKEELILESVRTETAKIRKTLEHHVADSSCALEALLRFKRGMYQRHLCICPAFHRDLPGFPPAYSKFIEFKNQMRQRVRELFEQAIGEGMLIREQNYDLMAHLYAEDTENSAGQYELMLTLLRGSCTPRGKEWIDRFQYTDQGI
ncbi:MAG: TetR/AcrR family transcriptional regulator [Bacteroides sp.]|nr:TetR/AcrR family transcriptional regulator [Bacteroides sp.]